MKTIRLGDYIDLLTDYHSGGSYETLKNNTKILHKPDYGVYVRTLNFERNDFEKDLVYCDKSSYDFLEYSHLKENDVLMNKIANPGSVYLMPKVDYPATCAMNLFLIRFKNISQKYMYYVMKNNEAYIKKQAHGTTTKTITKEEVRDLVFEIHETEEERNKVEKILSDLDKKIKINDKINNNLQAQINSIYNYWFTQFDFPNENNQPYCSSGGKMVWNDTLKQNIPENWTVKCVLDILSWQSNSQPPKSMFIYEPKDGYIRFIQNRDYDSDDYKTYIPKSKSLTLCNSRDILIDKYGDAGRVRYGLDGAFNVALAKLNLHDTLLLEYVRCYFESEPIYNYLHASCMASTRASLNESNIGNLYIVIPPQKLLEKFNSIVNPIRDKILMSKDENRKCISLRNWLLPMLINGQATIE